jgi:acetyl-CoA carboxylase alpha subunit
MTDWCSSLLADVALHEPGTPGRNPISWSGYEPRPAVRFGDGRVVGHDVVACVWDFAAYGGSLGEVEADTVAAAVARAVSLRRPLLTIVRTGGTRLQEGVAALVGIARTAIALADLAAAGLPHLSIADHPTTGGVWVSVVSRADLRAGVAGATVGFSGPRVVEAMTGEPLPPGANTAESAAAAGLLDAVVAPSHIASWLRSALAACSPHGARTVVAPADLAPADVNGWTQVQRARDPHRVDGAALLDLVLDGAVQLGAADDSVRAVIGRSAADRSTVGVALAAHRSGRPTTAGFDLLARAAQLADRVGADLCTFVDTPGADPLPASEQSGLAPAIGHALLAVFGCRSPSLAVVHGEGGSGGALAATVTDRVLVTGSGYFTALAPEGAGMALHITPAEAADRGAVTPAALQRLGFADAIVLDEPEQLRAALAFHLAKLAGQAHRDRLAARTARWSGPLPGRC